MTVGAIIYTLLTSAWSYQLQGRALRNGGTVEARACAQTVIDDLASISITGSGELYNLQQDILNPGGKITPMVSSQTVAPPRVTYQITGTDPNDTKHGPSKLDEATVRIACHALTYEQATAILQDVRTCIDRFSGSVGTATVQSVQFLDENELYSEDADLVGLVQLYKFRIER